MNDQRITPAGWANTSVYSDVGEVMELSAVHDDTLKKDDAFVAFAVMVAQRIADETDFHAKITWGKWGARIEPQENPHLDELQIRELASRIIRHPSWTGLTLATWIFTYGTEAEA